MTDNERKEYCKDCKRSIYGEYHDCDINIENNGHYVMADEKCYCKILPNGQRAEKYPWEEDMLSHEIEVKGNCTVCGKPMGEHDGLFLCSECQKKNKEEE